MAHRGDLAPGWIFNPPDRELTDTYLRREIDGQPIAASFMHHVDVYSAAPEKLVEGRQQAPGIGEAQRDQDKRAWYFFTTLRHAGKNVAGRHRRISRTIGGADDGKKRWWHSEGSAKPAKGSAAGGELQKFSYKVESMPGGWLMTEYSIRGAGDLVLCKIYKTPRPRRPHVSSPASSSSSSCTTSTVADLSGSGCKRKASGDHPDAPTTTQRKTHEAYYVHSARHETDQDIEGFSFCTDDPTPVPRAGDFHASASASSSSGKSGFLDFDAGVTVDYLDAPVVRHQSAAPPAAVIEEDAGLGYGAESGVAVDDLLDDTSNDGFLYEYQEPAAAPPCRSELLSAPEPPSNTSQNDLLHAPASNTAWLDEGEVTVDDLLDHDAALDGSNDGFLHQDEEPAAASPCRNELLPLAVDGSNSTSPPSQNELLPVAVAGSNSTSPPSQNELLPVAVAGSNSTSPPSQNELLPVAVAGSNSTSPPSQNELLPVAVAGSNSTSPPSQNELLPVVVAGSTTASPPSQNALLHAPASNTTWDPTDAGRYELLSTYVLPPCRDEEDAVVEWPEAGGMSDLDLFWGTPNGVCMY
uniref:NAC domain-containing protein n=1 Tax=Hordeum vulgare subsp. vulgare TaxID=112509 RepID=A0A8I7B6T5_HORVV